MSVFVICALQRTDSPQQLCLIDQCELSGCDWQVVRMLQSLASLQAWLEAVELSIRQASLAGDPESVSVAEQESCQLEQELEARRLELQNLRQEVDYLSSQRHLHTQLLPARLKDVEKKYVPPVHHG